MVVKLEDGLRKADIASLVERLEAEDFAEGCWISAIAPVGHSAEHKIYVRLPKALHGVVLPSKDLDEKTISWTVKALRDSVK